MMCCLNNFDLCTLCTCTYLRYHYVHLSLTEEFKLVALLYRLVVLHICRDIHPLFFEIVLVDCSMYPHLSIYKLFWAVVVLSKSVLQKSHFVPPFHLDWWKVQTLFAQAASYLVSFSTIHSEQYPCCTLFLRRKFLISLPSLLLFRVFNRLLLISELLQVHPR